VGSSRCRAHAATPPALPPARPGTDPAPAACSWRGSSGGGSTTCQPTSPSRGPGPAAAARCVHAWGSGRGGGVGSGCALLTRPAGTAPTAPFQRGPCAAAHPRPHPSTPKVLAHSVPSLSHYRPEAARRAVLPDLAALVWSGVNHLVWPPLAHADVGYASTVAVHVIYMHQVWGGGYRLGVRAGWIVARLRCAAGSCGGGRAPLLTTPPPTPGPDGRRQPRRQEQAAGGRGVGSGSRQRPPACLLRRGLIGASLDPTAPCPQAELADALGGAQTVTVDEHWIPFGNCPQCVAGYSG
jgi:hypothetical protein